MKTNTILWVVLLVAFVAVVAFSKQKVCQGANGNLRSVSWLWPCASGEDAITSASTD